MQPPQFPNSYLNTLASTTLKLTPTGTLMGVKIQEASYMTKTEIYTITKRIPGRGIYRRIKSFREVPSDEIIIVNGSTMIAHPQTVAKIKDKIASQINQDINAVILTNLERSILLGQQNK